MASCSNCILTMNVASVEVVAGKQSMKVGSRTTRVKTRHANKPEHTQNPSKQSEFLLCPFFAVFSICSLEIYGGFGYSASCRMTARQVE